MDERPSLLAERLSALPQLVQARLRPRRVGPFLVGTLRALGLAAVFLSAATGALVIHLNSGESRRVTALVVNRALAPVLRGRIEIGRIEELSLVHARVADAHIYDAEGEEVIAAEGIDGRVDTIGLLRDLGSGEGPLALRFSRARVEHASVTLRPGEQNIPTLAWTFLPRVLPTPSAKPGRPVIIDLPEVEIGEAHVEGDVGVHLSGDVRRVGASVYVKTDEVVRVDVKETGLAVREIVPGELSGSGSYHLEVDLPALVARRLTEDGLEPIRMRADVAGSLTSPDAPELAPIAVSASGELAGLHLIAKLDLPRADPAALRHKLPWLPIHQEIRGTRVWLDGDLPAISFSALSSIQAEGHESPVAASGRFDVRAGLALNLELSTKGLDARAILPTAPQLTVDGRALIRVALAPEDPAPHISLEVATRSASGLGFEFPPIDAVLDVVDDRLVGSATLLEEGLPVDARFTVADGRVAFSAAFASDDLGAAPRLAPLARGGVRGRVDGELAGGILKSKISASTWAATLPRVDGAPGVERASVEAELGGPLDRLTVSGTVAAHGLRALGERIDDVVLTAKGPLLEPHVDLSVVDRARGDARIRADVSLRERRAQNVHFDIAREGETARGTLGSARIGASGFEIDKLTVKEGSIGAISGDLRVDRGELLGGLHGENVDLAKLRRLLAIPGTLSGVANLDVKVEKSARGRRGAIEVELEGGQVGQVEGVSARLSAKLDGDGAEASGFVRLVDDATKAAKPPPPPPEGGEVPLVCDGAIAEVRFADVSAKIKGPLLALSTWRDAVGTADLAADNLDLGCLARRFPEPFSAVDSVRGRLSAHTTLRRAEGDPFPSLEGAALATRGLAIVGRGARFKSTALDVDVALEASGKSGDVHADIEVHDERVLARTSLDTTLALQQLFGDAKARTEALRSAPITARLRVPGRSFSSLASLPEPYASMLPALDGEVTALVELDGSIARPSLYLSAQGFGVAAHTSDTGGKQWMPPLNLDLSGSYEPSTGRALGGLSVAVERAPVALVSAAIDVPVEALTSGREEPLPWSADVTADFYDLPLHAVPELADREIAGALSGRVSYLGINRAPRASVELVIPALRVQDTFLKATLKGELGPSEPGADVGQAQLQVELEDQGGGRLQVLGYGGVSLADRVLLRPDWKSSGGLIVGAKEFGLGAFYPLVAGALTKLDGELSGGVHLEWGELEQASRGRIKSADLSLENVVAYIPQFGQELSDGHAVVRADPPRADGRQDIQIQNVEAKGSSGRVHGFATATLDGLLFERGTASLFIDPGEELPITVEGVPLGKVRGEARVAVAPDDRGLVLDVRVPTARFDLPAASSRDVQPLDDARGVHITPSLSEPTLPRAPDALRYKLNVAVDDVEVKSTQLNLRLKSSESEPLRLELADRLHASGDVLLQSGSIVLNKRKFEIDEGLIRLRDEETGNPWVNLTAHWESSASTRVFVDYVGLLKPISDDKIHFRSDPPRTQDQIVKLLVFGESDKEQGESASATNLAGSVIGGNVATSFANDLIASAFGGVLRDVLALNVGTTETGGGYFGAQVNLKQFSFGGSVEQVEQSTTPTSTARAGGCGDFFFDYKISTHWTLRGSGAYCDFQDQTAAGASSTQDGISLGLDVLWQYRY